MNAATLGIVCLLAIVSAPLAAEGKSGHATTHLPEHHAADPGAPVVTDRNVLASERFWPYHVALVRPRRLGNLALPAGAAGVLIRVEAPETARIDFGRDGLHLVPVADTDLLERANLIRLGKFEKDAPNFLFDIGPRLLDSASEAPRPAPYEALASGQVLLCVFADPAGKGFPELVRALAPATRRRGAATILFPQGGHSDAQVHETLRTLEFQALYLYGHLSEPYTRSLLADSTAPPALLLVTPDGRVLFQRRWRTGVASELRRALDDALGD
jgi:hypothetical protein